MTLRQLLETATVLDREYGGDVEVIVRGSKLRPRLAGTTDEWDLRGVEVDAPCKPWEGGEAVVVLNVEG
jgi:hypothetical protein